MGRRKGTSGSTRRHLTWEQYDALKSYITVNYGEPKFKSIGFKRAAQHATIDLGFEISESSVSRVVKASGDDIEEFYNLRRKPEPKIVEEVDPNERINKNREKLLALIDERIEERARAIASEMIDERIEERARVIASEIANTTARAVFNEMFGA